MRKARIGVFGKRSSWYSPRSMNWVVARRALCWLHEYNLGLPVKPSDGGQTWQRTSYSTIHRNLVTQQALSDLVDGLGQIYDRIRPALVRSRHSRYKFGEHRLN